MKSPYITNTEELNATIEAAKTIWKGLQRQADEISAAVKGKKAVVLTDYNGQPFGSSKKSMKGKEVTITSAYFATGRGELWFWIKESRLAIGSDEVEIIW